MNSHSPLRFLISICCVTLIFYQAADCQDRVEETLAAKVKSIFRNHCVECHGDTRKEAGLHLLDWESFVGKEGSVIPNDVEGSYLFERVATDDEDFRMPEAPFEPLSSEQIETVRKWIVEGAPKFPDDVEQPDEKKQDPALSGYVGAEYVFSQIVDFIEKQPRDDRQYYRFFSSNHNLTAGATRDELKIQKQALAKAINHLSMQPSIVRPTVVDKELETIFAIDIRKTGWHKRPFVNRDHHQSNFDLFDLILIEYPYGIAFPDSENFEKLWDIFISRSEMIRPIPYIRVDWFISVATQFPLYEDILGLPDNLSDLESFLGVDSELNLHDFIARRAGMTVSGVSQNNRVVERHPARFGAYWKSYDFQTSKGRQNMFIDPLHFDFAGGEMIFNLPNGLQGYLITDKLGKRINAAPTNIVTDKFASDHVVRNGLACMRCHDKGIRRFADNIRSAVEALPSTSLSNKNEILKLYPNKLVMDELLVGDEHRFMSAMERALGEPQKKDPLASVARNYLDAAIAIGKATSELGQKDVGQLNTVFALPQFTKLGLAGLSDGGVVRRDAWEDYFDQIVHGLGIGVPIVPVDGLIREDHLADEHSDRLILKTNSKRNVFSPGEKAVISVENSTGKDLFIEVIGLSSDGRIAELSKGVVTLRNGGSTKYPDSGGFEIQPGLGKEKVSVFASPIRFERGQLLTAKDDGTFVADRFVHDWYDYEPSAPNRFDHKVSALIKKTIVIETK